MNGNSINSIIIQAWRRLAPLALGVVCLAASPRALAACDCDTTACDICVRSGHVNEITGRERINCIEVEAGGLLNIEDGGTLTVTGPEPSCVDGYVILVADATEKAVLKFTSASQTVSGSGDIVGQDNDAEIQIDGVTLTSQVSIKGSLHIKNGNGAGTFDNRGSVIAHYPNGTISLNVTTIDDTSGSGRWQVTTSDAMLRFYVEPQPLEGSFTVSNGTLRAGADIGADDIDVCTSGDLTHTGGKIVAGWDDSFCFNCDCP